MGPAALATESRSRTCNGSAPSEHTYAASVSARGQVVPDEKEDAGPPSSTASWARPTGVVWLLFFVASGLSEVFFRMAGISGISTVSGDGASIASTLATHQDAFRAGFASSLILIVLYAVLMALFYRLLRPVNATLAVAALVLSMIALTVQAFGAVPQLMAFSLATGTSSLQAFSDSQSYGLMLFLFRMYLQGYTVALIFWGPFWLLVAYLVYRSTFFPRLLAVPLALEGLGALTLLWPPLAAIAPFAIVAGVAELVFMLWLLVRGVDEQRWRERDGLTRRVVIA